MNIDWHKPKTIALAALSILLVNAGLILLIRKLPIPEGVNAHIYYSHFILDQAVANLFLCVTAGYNRQRILTATLAVCTIILLLLAAA